MTKQARDLLTRDISNLEGMLQQKPSGVATAQPVVLRNQRERSAVLGHFRPNKTKKAQYG